MVNIRKIVLLSALLMSASSITAPTYAMDGDEQGVSTPRVTYAQRPPELTQDVISEIRQHGSFLAAAKEYVLQNPEQLDLFFNPNSLALAFDRSQCFFTSGNELVYMIHEYGFRHPTNYDPARPEETKPEWYFMELSRLTFREQDPFSVSMQTPMFVDPADEVSVGPEVEFEEPVSASSMQASSSIDPSHEVDPETAIKSLIERHGSDQQALVKALAELWEKKPFL